MLDAEFIDGPLGRLLITLRTPDAGFNGPCVLVAPAFGDEMNKTRKMVTETAKQLNALGLAVATPDLFGTGDSEGEFGDAGWGDWVNDLEASAKWLVRNGMDVWCLLGIRTGALLAGELVRLSDVAPVLTIFWQPVRDGGLQIRQLLRMRTIASAVADGQKEKVADLVNDILAGHTTWAGGYPLSQALVAPMIESRLEHLVSERLGHIHSIEIVRDEERAGDRTETVGSRSIGTSCLMGEPYWNSTELVCDANVIRKTIQFVEGYHGN
jgi:exosortase A-associated hydrolase 2